MALLSVAVIFQHSLARCPSYLEGRGAVEAAMIVAPVRTTLRMSQERGQKTESSGQRGGGTGDNHGKKTTQRLCLSSSKGHTVATDVADSSVVSLCQGQLHPCGFDRGAQVVWLPNPRNMSMGKTCRHRS